jgi:uncharacterized membrane protein
VSAQGQAVLMATVIELVLAAMSVTVVVNWWRAARGGLERNAYIGLRTPSTLRNEQSWVTGNRAAARTAPLYLLFNAAMSAVLFAAAWHGWRLVVAFLGGGGFFVLIGLMICTAVIASRAARAAGGPADRRGALNQSEMPDLNAPLSGRAMTIVGWISTVILCGLAVFMLGTIVDGYALAIHHQLQPNTTTGFRDDVAFSCLPRWYAAQKAGFSWLLFGYGPVAIGGLILCAAAAITRRSPWDLCALVIGTLCLAIVFVVAAGIHADNVARAVTC